MFYINLRLDEKEKEILKEYEEQRKEEIRKVKVFHFHGSRELWEGWSDIGSDRICPRWLLAFGWYIFEGR